MGLPNKGQLIRIRFQSCIPWPVALHRSLPPLLYSFSINGSRLHNHFWRTATVPNCSVSNLDVVQAMAVSEPSISTGYR